MFLNFRGKDTRQGFVSCLAHCLEKLHINFFYDDKSIREAGKIPDEIVKAIEIAKIYIPIFSRNYASSNWCLRELQLMVKQEQGKEKKILPIFYDVEPIDVKLKSKLYEEDLERLKQEYGPRKVDEWKNAMTAVARIKGWELKKKR